MEPHPEVWIDLDSRSAHKRPQSSFRTHKQEGLQAKIHQLRTELEQFYQQPAGLIQMACEDAVRRIEELEALRCTAETWILVDMDMFYVAVEIRERPKLAMQPVAVVFNGMITASNYVARRFGVKSGTPLHLAEKRCPNMVQIASRMEKYKAASREVRAVLSEYDPLMETKGLDEAYLLVTKLLLRRGTNNDAGRVALAEEIRGKVYSKTGMTASAGIGCNKLIAKICSEVNKPNGQFYLRPEAEDIRRFMSDLDVSEIPKVGKVLKELLTSIGISTCRQVLEYAAKIAAGFPHTISTMLFNSALGIGTSDHSERIEDQRSLSVCHTFPPTSEPRLLEEHMRVFCDQLEAQLSERTAGCRTVTVFYKTESFQELSKSETGQGVLDKRDDIWRVAGKLLRGLYPIQSVRMLGCRLSRLVYSKEQQHASGQLIQTRLTQTPPKPVAISKKQKQRQAGDQDLFQALMNSSILPNHPLTMPEKTVCHESEEDGPRKRSFQGLFG